MAKNTKTNHVRIRNEALFCSHCGSSQAVAYPVEIPVFTAMMDAFAKNHAECPKTWKEPELDQSLAVREKADFWWKHGERGISSMTMFAIFCGRHMPQRPCHPLDPDDFRRCYLLLKAVPEWREKLPLLKAHSSAWSNLVDHWDELTAMLEEMMAGKKSSAMYDLMQKLITE